MSDDTRDESLIEQISSLYREFQDTLNAVSHEHLKSSREVLEKADENRQESLRQKIKDQS